MGLGGGPGAPMQGMAGISDRQKVEMLDLRRLGYSVRELAREYGCDPATIRYHLRRAQELELIEARARNPRTGPVDRGQVLQLLRDGCTHAQVAAMAGTSAGYVSRLAVQARRAGELEPGPCGVDQPPGRPAEVDRTLVAELRRQGLTQAAIAARAGCSAVHVGTILREAGFPPCIHPRRVDRGHVLALRAAGAAHQRIAAEVGCSAATVQRILRAEGDPLASRGDPATIARRRNLRAARQQNPKNYAEWRRQTWDGLPPERDPAAGYEPPGE